MNDKDMVSVKGSIEEDNNVRSLRMKAFLEGLYYVYNRREVVDPDPLMFLYNYERSEDREIVGLVASTLAYGRVAQILKSVQKILAPLGSHPHEFLLHHTGELEAAYSDFKHRFTTGAQMYGLLARSADVLRQYGTLEALMRECLTQKGSFIEALNMFSYTLEPEKKGFSLLTAPEAGSACKRLMLYMKWMVRSDDVDPGCWHALSTADLIMPTDTHIHHIAMMLGLTSRKQADLKAAQEITANFAKMTPEDPTRYDFVLSRFGIRSGLDKKELLSLLAVPPAN